MTPIAPRRHGAALFWAVAIICFFASAAAIAARVSFRAADAYSAGLRGAMTVRIISPDTDAAVESAASALRTAAGIYSARTVTPSKAAELLSRWGGPGIEPSELPPLRLIELEVDKSQATPEFARRIEHALAQVGFQAEVYGPGQWVENWAQVAEWFRRGAVALAAALGLAALLVVGLAARARAAADRALVAPLADMGATRGQVAAIFAGRAAGEGLLAGLTGALAATMLGAYALYYFLPDLPPREWLSLFTFQDAAPLVATPLLAGLLSAAGARAAANRAYGRAAKLA